MKKIIIIPILMLAASCFAANPSFQQVTNIVLGVTANSITNVTQDNTYAGHVTQTGQSISIGTNPPASSSTSYPNTDYFSRLNALMEPDAIEDVLTNQFTNSYSSTTTEYVIASWQTKLGPLGRMEVRDPRNPLALRNVTLIGKGTGSFAFILNPALCTYTNPFIQYYDRLDSIETNLLRTVAVTTVASHVPFLPGAYGAIIKQTTCFDYSWIVLRVSATWGVNLMNEISDVSTQRVSNGGLVFPVAKSSAGEIESASFATGGATPTEPSGSVSFVLLSSNWTTIPDTVSSSYVFRDDFMQPTLETNIAWQVNQSTAGNILIDTNYQWLKLNGAGNWLSNNLVSRVSFPLVSNRTMVVDAFMPRNSSGGFATIGFMPTNSITNAIINYSHCFNFGGNQIQIYEDGNLRSTLSGNWTNGAIYRLRISLKNTNAVYSIQGGLQYPRIGSTNWFDVTPALSSTTNISLYSVGASVFSGTGYISDYRVY